MAGGFKISNTNGRACLNSSGQIIICGVCCPDCLAGTVLDSATLSASGIVTASGCSAFPSSGSCTTLPANFSYTSTVNANVSGLTVPRNVSAGCTWNTSVITGTTTQYTNLTCTGSPLDTGSGYQWSLVKTAGLWKLYAFAGFTAAFDVVWFIGSVATSAGTDCTRTLTFTNLLTSTTSGYYVDPIIGCVSPLATGGSAIVTFP